MEYLRLARVTVGYRKGEPILSDFDLTVREGELVSLLGPSGCGKTTTLRTIAGFLFPWKGKVLLKDRDYTRVPPHRRNFGLVYQNYALFPHLSVFENVAFGLRMRRLPQGEIQRRVEEALRLVRLEGLERRLPGQLSGGQRQRVALARALVIRPELLLLDEPLSNLDAKLRAGMRTELKRIQRELSVTAIYVTHDQSEAMALSDRVVLMRAGRIEQEGTPAELYFRPATPFAADFMGFTNRFDAVVEAQEGEELVLRAGGIRLRARGEDLDPGAEVTVAIRPTSLRLFPPGGEGIPGRVVSHAFQGESVQYVVETELGELVVVHPESSPRFAPGDVVVIRATPEEVAVFPRKEDI